MTESVHNPSRLLWGIGIAAGYALLLWGNPAHSAFRDGFRCIRRYPKIVFTLAALGFWYAVSEEALRYFAVGGEEDSGYAWWSGWFPPDWIHVCAPAALPAFEATAGLFNSLITTFPISIIAAFLLGINWAGSRKILGHALKKHYPRGSLLLLLFITASALCAMAKPALVLSYSFWLERFPSPATPMAIEAIQRFAFLFEYGFSVFIQITLITMAYVWIRGITFDPDAIREFALRRLGAVMRWAMLIYLLSLVAIDLPLLLEPHLPAVPEAFFDTFPTVARWTIHGFLLVLPVVQIRMVFHNETVHHALRDQWRYWRKYHTHLLWFVLVAFLIFFPLATVDQYLTVAFGRTSAPGIAWNLLYPFLWAPIAAWMLSSWVCLFKQMEARHPEVDEWNTF